MPNTFPIRNLIPESSNQLVSYTLCIRGYLVYKYVSFTRAFVCLVKQTGDSESFQNKIHFPFPKRKDRNNRRPRGLASKNMGSHSGDSAGDFLRGLDSKPK